MSQPNPSAVDPGKIALRARNVEFDWAGVPLHWMPTEAFASHTVSALNLLLPEGERWFCATYAEALPLITDEKLREDVIGFIGQESVHAETHNKVLYEFLDANGVDPRPYVRQSEFIMRKVLGPRDASSPRVQHQQLVERLAFIGAIEHMTAFLGDYALNSRWDEFNAHPKMVDLFRWHGAEEVEHRNVAHEVAEYFGVGYFRRNIAMAITYAAFILLLIRGTRFIANQDPALPQVGVLGTWGGLLGAMRRGSLPSLWKMTTAVAAYVNPRYSPETIGNTAQAVAYLASSPGAKAGV
ncbi:metal-dependent hydrolase [Tomitella biformata]|uniref:metal-dependent hydrolase n=1 Tax=Tomitella biformata TaxID=630403 RepID=UPI0004BCF552|nr:metal-dependent hydrolase [Tomitella biformata]